MLVLCLSGVRRDVDLADRSEKFSETVVWLKPSFQLNSITRYPPSAHATHSTVLTSRGMREITPNVSENDAVSSGQLPAPG